jgi:hypothetical protein
MGVTALALAKNGALIVGGGNGSIARMRPGVWKAEVSKKLEGAVTSLSLRGEGHDIFAGTSHSNIYRVAFADFATDLRTVGHFEHVNVRCFCQYIYIYVYIYIYIYIYVCVCVFVCVFFFGFG